MAFEVAGGPSPRARYRWDLKRPASRKMCPAFRMQSVAPGEFGALSASPNPPRTPAFAIAALIILFSVDASHSTCDQARRRRRVLRSATARPRRTRRQYAQNPVDVRETAARSAYHARGQVHPARPRSTNWRKCSICFKTTCRSSASAPSCRISANTMVRTSKATTRRGRASPVCSNCAAATSSASSSAPNLAQSMFPAGASARPCGSS